jgi:DNA replication and repair protein RecF
LRRGLTLIGPHRDDFTYELDGRDLSSFGSRGQQRLAVVATKLAELAQIITLSGESPVLLLDDVLSELDPEHQDGLLNALGGAGCQIILTATSRELLEHPALRDLPIGEVGGGTIALDLG